VELVKARGARIFVITGESSWRASVVRVESTR
jgi:hypothetical protein